MTKPSLALFGLPGCGKNRLKNSWRQAQGFEAATVDYARLETELGRLQGYKGLVIDSRSFWQFPRDNWLQQELLRLAESADFIVLNFLESSDLSVQVQWKSWLKASLDLPILLSLNHAVPQGLAALLSEQQISNRSLPELNQQLQTYHFSLPKVSLSHLMMVLDNGKSALGMKIIRAKGVFNTVEYDNLVMLEGSAYRWDCYAATEQESQQYQGCLVLQGYDLEKGWLQQMLLACAQ